MSDEDIETFYEHLNNKIATADDTEHEENAKPETIDLGFLSVECPECSWEKPITYMSPGEIPETDVHCKCCGRKLIQYTHVSDSLLMFDNGEY